MMDTAGCGRYGCVGNRSLETKLMSLLVVPKLVFSRTLGPTFKTFFKIICTVLTTLLPGTGLEVS